MEIPRPGTESELQGLTVTAKAKLDPLLQCSGLRIELAPPQATRAAVVIFFFFFFFFFWPLPQHKEVPRIGVELEL